MLLAPERLEDGHGRQCPRRPARGRDHSLPARPELLDDRLHERGRAAQDRQPSVGPHALSLAPDLQGRLAGRREQRHLGSGRSRDDRPGARGWHRPPHRASLERHRRRALPGPRGVRLAASSRPARRDVGGALHRRPRAGPRRAPERPPLHDPLGEPAGLRRGLSRHRGQRRPLRDRRQATYLLGRDRGARSRALSDRRAPWPGAGDQGIGAVSDGPDPRAARPPAAADPHARSGSITRSS